MDAQRLYIDSRDRASGTATDFEYQLVNSIPVAKEFVATIDCVLIPVSWYTITQGQLYIAEFNGSAFEKRVVTIPQGYYDALTLSKAVETGLNTDSILLTPYTVSFDTKSGRISIANAWRNNEQLYVYTKEHLVQRSSDSELAQFGLVRGQEPPGAFKELGLVSGSRPYRGARMARHQWGNPPYL